MSNSTSASLSAYSKARVKALDLTNQKRLYLRAKEAYYNTANAIMSDAVFDYLEDIIKAADPKWAGLKKVGAPVAGKKTESKLVVPMASLNKVKADNPAAFSRWRAKQTAARFIVGPKLDGSSIQAVYSNGIRTKLLTRGNGLIGKTLDHLADGIADAALPRRLKFKWNGVLRLEAVVEKDVWEKHYKEDFASARAMSSGVLNRMDIHRSLKAGHVRFVVLRMMQDGVVKTAIPSISAGLEKARKLGFQVVPFSDFDASETTAELMTTMIGQMEDWDLDFAMDGLVCFADEPGLVSTGDNPDYGIAFKMDEEADDAQQATILSIEYNVTRTKRVVPTAVISPVKFDDGVTVQRATLNNVPWANERQAGVGAKVRVIRGGEIIPKVVRVDKTAKYTPPTARQLGVGAVAFQGKDMVVTDVGDSAAHVRKHEFAFAFQVLGMKHLAGTAAAALEKSFAAPLDMVACLYSADPVRELARRGVNAKIAQRAISTLPKTQTVSALLRASGVFPRGLGSTLLEKIVDAKAPVKQGDKLIGPVWGEAELEDLVGPVASAKYLHFYSAAYDAINKAGLARIVGAAPKAAAPSANGPLKGQIIYMTGYRDDAQSAAILKAGGTMAKAFNKQTTILLHKAGGKASGKIATAKASGIRVCTFEELGIGGVKAPRSLFGR